MELMPGLPDDVAMECLIRTQHSDFSSLSSVCKSWKHQIASPGFLRQRRNSRMSRILIAMAQALPDVQGGKCYTPPSGYRLTILDPEIGKWSELPPPPGGLPMFCKLAGFGSDLVVVGGWDLKTFAVSRSVYVYSFITATWRRGAHMPEPARSFFGCAAHDGVVYVAGGHDEGKNALRSVLMYDVARDEWERVDEMADERDECQAVVQLGKLYVIGGYSSAAQGRFERSAEVLDLKTRKWEQVNVGFLDVASCHKTCTSHRSDMYTCLDGHVAVRTGEGKWKKVVEMPPGIGDVACTAAWGDGMMVVIGGKSLGFVLDLKSLKWIEVGTPPNLAGIIHSGCDLEI